MRQVLPKHIHLIKNTFLYLGVFTLLFLPYTSFANAPHALDKNDIGKNPYIKALIKGSVADATDGQPLAGVSIKIEGSDLGTTTDAGGNFTIQANATAVLIFTYLGYESYKIIVGEKTNFQITLHRTAKNLNEVIVVGYGTQKKIATTAAVSTLSVKDIAHKPVVNLTNDLVGRVAGVIATQGSGEPGFDGSSFSIRGVGSIGGSNVLLIVDGVPRDFSRLDPNSIATLTVLKDAAAVAPYGVAGANGVILVTTKQGASGAPVFSYNGYAGTQNPTRLPTFVNGYQYALMKNDAAVNDFYATVPYTAADLQKFQDHSDPDVHGNAHPLQDIVKSNRLITNHNLSLSGGSETFKYFASLGYTHQNGMWDPTYLDKYNLSLNLTSNATKTTTVNFTLNSWIEDQHFPSQSAGTIIGQAQRETPDFPVRYHNGLTAGYIAQSVWGEIYNSGYSFNENTGIQSQFSINQQLPVKGLSLKGVVSFDIAPDPLLNTGNGVSRNYTTPIPFYTVNPFVTPYTYTLGYQGSAKPSFNESYNQTHAFTYQGIVDYKTAIGKSNIGFTGVVEERIVKSEGFAASRIDYNLGIDELNYGGPLATDATNSGSSSGQKSLGYVYRADYNYGGKYFLEAAGRYDGSYLFAPGHRFGFFPSFSANWLLSQENFIKKNLPWVTILKLRGSYGNSGAYPRSGGNILTYQYLIPFNLQSNDGVLNGSALQGINQSLQGNPDITWERAKKADIGFEATLWNGELSVEADYFFERRSNMLANPGAKTPGEYGVNLALVNGGIMNNHGIEVTLGSSHSFSEDLRLDINGTFTFARNKLLQVYENASTYNNLNRRQTGRPYGTQFGLKALGYYTPDDFVDPTLQTPVLKSGIPIPSYGVVRPGDIKYADLSSTTGKPDGKIDINDQTVIGHPQTPEITYGLEPRLTYKNFDIDLLFQGSANTSLNTNNFIVFPFQMSGSASELSFTQYWKPDRTNTLYPRISNAPSSNNTQSSSWFIRNDAYIRLKSVELGYTFSKRLLGTAIKSLRIFAAGQNIFTWTPYMREIIDPENSGSDQNYYQQRVLTIGINVKF